MRYYTGKGEGVDSLVLHNDYEYLGIEIYFRSCVLGEVIVESSTLQ